MQREAILPTPTAVTRRVARYALAAAKWTGISALVLALHGLVAAMCLAAFLTALGVALGVASTSPAWILDVIYPSRHSCEEHPERDNDPELCWPPHPRR